MPICDQEARADKIILVLPSVELFSLLDNYVKYDIDPGLVFGLKCPNIRLPFCTYNANLQCFWTDANLISYADCIPDLSLFIQLSLEAITSYKTISSSSVFSPGI